LPRSRRSLRPCLSPIVFGFFPFPIQGSFNAWKVIRSCFESDPSFSERNDKALVTQNVCITREALAQPAIVLFDEISSRPSRQ